MHGLISNMALSVRGSMLLFLFILVHAVWHDYTLSGNHSCGKVKTFNMRRRVPINPDRAKGEKLEWKVYSRFLEKMQKAGINLFLVNVLVWSHFRLWISGLREIGDKLKLLGESKYLKQSSENSLLLSFACTIVAPYNSIP